MVGFSLQVDYGGWGKLTVRTKQRAIEADCADTGGDALAAFMATFARLTTANDEHKTEIEFDAENRSILTLANDEHMTEIEFDAENRWVVFALRRRGDELELTATRFQWEGDRAPQKLVDRALETMDHADWERMRRARRNKPALRYRGPFSPALISFTEAVQKVLDTVGRDGYEARWGFDFPTDAFEVLRAAADAARRQDRDSTQQ